MNDDTISRKAAVNALWKALYAYEDKTEKQFLESEDLDIYDWMVHRIFVQNMSDIDRRTILDLPSAERQEVQSSGCKYWDSESNFCSLHRPSAERRGQWTFNIDDKGWSWDRPYICDQCGEWNGRETPYCPNCGARMEGEKE